MLVENDYNHGKIRIHGYIRGKPNGKLIWNSIQNRPTPHPMVTDPPPTGSTIVPAPRKKLDSSSNDRRKKSKWADTQAEIILSQGLPRHIFNILNQTSTAQEIWNNVELLMQGSGRTLQQRKKICIDEYEPFVPLGKRLTPHHAPALSSPSTPDPQPTASSPNDALMATMTSVFYSLMVSKSNFPPDQTISSGLLPNSKTHARCMMVRLYSTASRKAPGNIGNTGARGKKVICYNCRGEGHVARQYAEAEAFLADVECTAPYDQPQALTTTNMFQANHEDALELRRWMKGHHGCYYQSIRRLQLEVHLDSDAEWNEIDGQYRYSFSSIFLITKPINISNEVYADISDKQEIVVSFDTKGQLDLENKVRQEQP
ncbi:hypothetical protein Tco_0300122 [Tanacetum coccineum]